MEECTLKQNEIIIDEINSATSELLSNGQDSAVDFIKEISTNDNDELLKLVLELASDDLLSDELIKYFYFLYENNAYILWYKYISLLFEEKFSRNESEFNGFFDTFCEYFNADLSIDNLNEIDKNTAVINEFIEAVRNSIESSVSEDSAENMEEQSVYSEDENDMVETEQLDKEVDSDNITTIEEDKDITSESGDDSRTDEFIDYLKKDIARLHEKLDNVENEKDDFASKFQSVMASFTELQNEYEIYKERNEKAAVSARILEKKLASSQKMIEKLNSINDRLLLESGMPTKDSENEIKLLRANLNDKDLLISSLQSQLDKANRQIENMEYNSVNRADMLLEESHSLADELSTDNITIQPMEPVEADYDESEVTHIDLPGLVQRIKSNVNIFGGFMAKVYENKFIKQSDPEQRALIMGKVIAAKYSKEVSSSVKDYLNNNKEDSKIELYKLLSRQVPEGEIIDFCSSRMVS